jgi:iron complex outermembrane receptor protein
MQQHLVRGVCAAALLVMGIASLSVRAVAQSTKDDAASGQLEEVIVTAQRRAEKLQDVPISAQVIGSQALAERNNNTLEDLTQTVPGVHIDNGGPFNNSIFIRGIGSGGNPTFDQSVAIFDDDIYHGRSRLSGATFLDLDRIEILKGPQSTFFGNNAIAGALNIVTKKPGDTFDASARLLYGMFGQYAIEGAVGGPITDTLSARVAVTRNGESGWITNVDTGQKAPDENNGAARLTLLYKPNDNLDATLKVEGSENRTSGTSFGEPQQLAYCPPPAPLSPGFGGYGVCAQALALHVPMGLNNNENTGLPGQGNQLSTFEDVLTINYHQWDHAFTSVSGFYNYHFNAQVDGFNLPTEFLTEESPERYHQFSQELRVASPTGGAIEYLAGAYFQTDQLGWQTELNIPFLNPGLTAGVPPLIPYLPLAQAVGFTQDEHVYSVFGSLRWNATDRLKLNAGLRGSWVKEEDIGTSHYGTGTQVYGGFVQLPPALEPIGAALLGRPAGTSPNLEDSEQAWMPSANIQYIIDPHAMAYLSYSRGFKAGGFDGESLLSQNFEYGPEHVNAYELGLKSSLLDDTVLVNVDVFRSDYQGLQVESAVYHPQLNGDIIQVANAAESRSQGVEFEGQWILTHDFRLSANVTYLDSYYVSYAKAPSQTLQQFCYGLSSTALSATPQCAAFPTPIATYANLSGQATNYAPRWSGSVNARYSVALSDAYRLITELSPYFSSRYNEQDPYVVGTAGYMRLDARVGLETSDHRWAVELIGKNLTDRVIVDVGDLYEPSKEQPRNVAIQARFHW